MILLRRLGIGLIWVTLTLNSRSGSGSDAPGEDTVWKAAQVSSSAAMLWSGRSPEDVFVLYPGQGTLRPGQGCHTGMLFQMSETRYVYNVTTAEVRRRIQAMRDREHGLQMLLMLLDATLPHQQRTEASRALAEILVAPNGTEALDHLRGRLYSAPLPTGVEAIHQAIPLAQAARCETVVAFLEGLAQTQKRIAAVSIAFEAIRTEHFADSTVYSDPSEAKDAFRMRLVEGGFFYAVIERRVYDAEDLLVQWKAYYPTVATDFPSCLRILKRWLYNQREFEAFP